MKSNFARANSSSCLKMGLCILKQDEGNIEYIKDKLMLEVY